MAPCLCSRIGVMGGYGRGCKKRIKCCTFWGNSYAAVKGRYRDGLKDNTNKLQQISLGVREVLCLH